MRTYLEIKVPISFDSPWFYELRKALAEIPVHWQTDYYHITMVFIDETPKGVDLQPYFERHLVTLNAPTLSFDKLDVFTTSSGMHIINLTTTVVPEDFLSAIEHIRTSLKTVGALIKSTFRLHVTLGRIIDTNLNIATIQNLIDKVSLPVLSLNLRDVNYREFRGRTLYITKLQTSAYETYTK